MVRTLVLGRYASEGIDKSHPHYKDIVRNWMPNMVDRAKMYILKEHLPKEKIIPDKCPHMQWGYEHKKFYIIFSGKIFAKPWFLGGLYEDNIEELQSYIRENINIDIPIDVLLDSRISTVDIKQDMLFPNTSILEFYISRMREMVSPQTRKAEGITFKSSIGYDSSMQIRSTCKSVRDTLSIYIKLNEIYANRQKDCGYYESLDDEFVDSIVRNIIRFERRISDAKHLRENNTIPRFLSKEEEERLMKTLETVSTHLKPLICLGLKTGMRRSEIFNLKWKDIDFKYGNIHVLNTKSGKARIIPLAQSLREMLEQMDKSSEYVFVNPQTDMPYTDIKHSFHTVLKAANIKNFRFHDIRHTFATRLAACTKDLVIVQAILGHASIQTTMRYAHVIKETLVNAISTLDSLC